MSYTQEDIERLDALIRAGLPQPNSPIGDTCGATAAAPSSGLTPSMLQQAIEDAKAVRTTALTNAQSALSSAFQAIDFYLLEESKSVDVIDEAIADALEDVKPSIWYPGYVAPTKPKREPKPNKNGNLYKDASFVPLDSHGNAKPANPNISITSSYIISPSYAPLYSTSSSYLGPSSGAAIQPSLNQNTNTKYSFNVSIGKPTHEKILINCIENSRNETINFSNNDEIIWEAVQKFNELHDPATKSKTILAGSKHATLNIHLTFGRLVFNGLSLTVEFDKYHVITSGGIYNYPECISETCSFFLEGEVYLNDEETKIEEATINSLNYVNPFRFDTVERITFIR